MMDNSCLRFFKVNRKKSELRRAVKATLGLPISFSEDGEVLLDVSALRVEHVETLFTPNFLWYQCDLLYELAVKANYFSSQEVSLFVIKKLMTIADSGDNDTEIPAITAIFAIGYQSGETLEYLVKRYFSHPDSTLFGISGLAADIYPREIEDLCLLSLGSGDYALVERVVKMFNNAKASSEALVYALAHLISHDCTYIRSLAMSSIRRQGRLVEGCVKSVLDTLIERPLEIRFLCEIFLKDFWDLAAVMLRDYALDAKYEKEASRILQIGPEGLGPNSLSNSRSHLGG